jgi:5-formyltetrahydrofolate cyclo-ligase
VPTAKATLRAQVLARRASMPQQARAAAAEAIAEVARAHLARRGWPRLAAVYVSVGQEPGTGPLTEALSAAGVRLIVPVLADDADLDWTPYLPGEPLHPGPLRTVHPLGPRLGTGALANADLVLIPALAVDRQGRRLGRGGGFYDRALRHARPDALVLAVVHDDEVLDEVPTEGHDRPVGGVLTPTTLAQVPIHQRS